MSRSRFLKHGFVLTAVTATLAALAALPAGGQVCDTVYEPYVFVLLDTSGSVNWTPICTQAENDAGRCGPVCPTGDCYAALQGDDPASKMFQMKAAVQAAVAGQSGILFGFGSFNQDQLTVRAKHWLYQAANGGPTIPGWGSYPTAGAREVFGYLWACDTGSADNKIGCSATTPADLPDAWELTRVQRLPKGGTALTQAVVFYVRQGTVVYKVGYTPQSGQTPGAATVNVTVRVDRCTNATCSTTSLVGTATTSWNRLDEFISWDNASSTNTNRLNPEPTFFGPTAADASAANSCAGWDPNTDTTADRNSSSLYNLRFLTDTSDPRGSLFYQGDVIPWDWTNDHNADLQVHMAPNLAGNLTALPDFGISRYLRDLPVGSETFLRLKDENQRPLIPVGSTPLGNTLKSFRTWYTGWRSLAMANDLNYFCRRKLVIVLSDGDGTCGDDACTPASALRTDGVNVYAVGFGAASTPGSQLACIAGNGGTQVPLYPDNLPDLVDALNSIFAAAKAP